MRKLPTLFRGKGKWLFLSFTGFVAWVIDHIVGDAFVSWLKTLADSHGLTATFAKLVEWAAWHPLLSFLGTTAITFVVLTIVAWSKPDPVDDTLIGTLLSRILQRESGLAKEVASLRRDLQTAVTGLHAQRGSEQQSLTALLDGDPKPAMIALRRLMAEEKALGSGHFKNASRAARDLGVIALVEDTKVAIDAYREAVALDPTDADAWNRLGVLLLHSGSLSEAAQAFNQALVLYQTSNNELRYALVLTNMGELHRLRGEFDRAMETQIAALSINKRLNDDTGLAANYSNLGVTLWNMGDLNGAEANLKRSLELEIRTSNNAGIASDHGNLGVLYLTLSNVRAQPTPALLKAESHLKQALLIDRRLQNNHGVAVHQGNLGMVCSRRADFADSDERRALIAQAERLVGDALAIARKFGYKDVEANQRSNVGVIKEDRGDIAGAVEEWSKARDLYASMGMTDSQRQMQHWIAAARPV